MTNVDDVQETNKEKNKTTHTNSYKSMQNRTGNLTAFVTVTKLTNHLNKAKQYRPTISVSFEPEDEVKLSKRQQETISELRLEYEYFQPEYVPRTPIPRTVKRRLLVRD